MFRHERRRRTLLLSSAVLLFFASSFVSRIFETRTSPVDSTGIGIGDPEHRVLSIALPDGQCQVTYAFVSETPIRPVWQASFPGSGARVSLQSVESESREMQGHP